jgi:ubiquinone/menaquinone biosynthesis C-methylase UbiE
VIITQFTDVAEVYDSLMAVVPYRHWVSYVERIWERFECSPTTVLDLACGTGNVTLELERHGYRVTGVDNSEAMLRQARLKPSRSARFLLQDARSLHFPEPFDACVCLFDSLNYLLTPEELGAAFAGVSRALHPRGIFIFDVNTVRALERGMFTQEGHGADPSLSYVWQSEYDPETRLCRIAMRFQVQTPTGTREFHETHLQRGYPLAEIRSLLEGAGLEVLGIYQSFGFRTATEGSDRAYFVARQPREPKF